MTELHSAVLHSLDDERLIRDGEAAVDLYNKDLKNARARIMPMARGLLAARRKYPADRDFGDWLQMSSYREIERNDRAALIKIGENDGFSSKYVRTTCLISPETIWDAIKELLPVSDDLKPTMDRASIVETPETPQEPAPTPILAVENVAVSDRRSSVTKQSRMYGMQRAEEVYAVFTDHNTRALIGKSLQGRGGKEIWTFILQAIDHRFLTRTSYATKNLTVRLLFPTSPKLFGREYDLADPKDRSYVRDVLMPAAIRNRDAILAAPENIADILRRDAITRRERVQLEEHDRKLATALQSLPTHEPEVILYGKYFWPIVDSDDPEQRYDYSQLQAAAWFFDDALKFTRAGTDNSPKSCGIKIRFLLGRLTRFNETMPLAMRARWRQIFGLIAEMARLMERSPDKEVGNRLPLLPLDKSYSD